MYRSHPSWVCGLKPYGISAVDEDAESHPSWVCGLKQGTVKTARMVGRSHPSWVCGLKLILLFFGGLSVESHPSWVCGLKPNCTESRLLRNEVTPFVGVWIETVLGSYHKS